MRKSKISKAIFILSRYINYKKCKLPKFLADWTFKCPPKALCMCGIGRVNNLNVWNTFPAQYMYSYHTMVACFSLPRGRLSEITAEKLIFISYSHQMFQFSANLSNKLAYFYVCRGRLEFIKTHLFWHYLCRCQWMGQNHLLIMRNLFLSRRHL